MRVLIIEDDANKLAQLSGFVRDTYPDARVSEKRSYQSGLKEIMAGDPPDLLLLDMTLPTYDIGGSEPGGRTRAFAGREILAQMHRRAIRTNVIIVTQYEHFGDGHNMKTLAELRDEMLLSYTGLYRGTVFYQPSESGWRVELKTLWDGIKLGEA